MASCSTTEWKTTAPVMKLSVTESSSTATSVTLYWKLQFIVGSKPSTSGDRPYKAVVNGSTVAEGEYDINGKLGTYTVDDGYITVSRGSSNKTISFNVWVNWEYLTWSGVTKTEMSATGSITIAARSSYTVTYNANGGSGAPSSQTKTSGVALTLSNAQPTRTGYVFQGWATSSTGSAVYEPGDSYTANASVTLYAVWKLVSYTVTYNANGGSGAPAKQTKSHGTALTLSSTKPTRTNYTFKGWGTAASATTVAYNPGETYNANSSVTLYAIWTLDYTKPRITNYTVARCDTEGNPSDEGTNALISFGWECDRNVTSITVDLIGGSSTKTVTISASGTSGTVNNKKIGDDAVLTDYSYVVRVTVKDSGGSTYKSQTLSGMQFAVDFLAGNPSGVSFGKPATNAGFADFGYNAVFDYNKHIFGVTASGQRRYVFVPYNSANQTIIGSGNYWAYDGQTHLYGYDVYLGASAVGDGHVYQPYRRKGHSLSFTLQTAGYVTNAGQDVTFLVPFAVPIIGNPTAVVTSTDGFVLRQGGSYTHGSAASTYVYPDSYTTARVSRYCGVMITARFSNTTNVTNNDAIGIYWSGTITFE